MTRHTQDDKFELVSQRIHTKIRPPGRWVAINFKELWDYRELLYFLIWRDIKVRYKQTVLGAAWVEMVSFVECLLQEL